jgi:signal recognition particle GTPase
MIASATGTSDMGYLPSMDVGQQQAARAGRDLPRDGRRHLVMTKLDRTARGGVLVSLAKRHGIPIHAISVGESADDLRPFEARALARSLVSLDA